MTRRLGLLAVVLGFIASAYAQAADVPRASNKWRIEVSEGANNDGVIEFRVTPHQGAPTTVSVKIDDGRAENGVARDIRDAFRAQLPEGRYSVETDDGEDVLIKKNLSEPDFSLELVKSSVEGVRIDLERE